MRVAYSKDEDSRPRFPRYRALLGFRDGDVERVAFLASIRRGAIGGAICWICEWNPRCAISGGLDSFNRGTYREARAELEACLFVELVGYRAGAAVLEAPVR